MHQSNAQGSTSATSIVAVILISSQKVFDLPETICLTLLLMKRYIELRNQELLALAETILSTLPVSNVVM